MAFTFNAQDIQMGTKALAYAGKYNVKIREFRDASTTRNGWPMRTVVFEVLDGSEKGASILHNFMDDSNSDRPFRYREINNMLVATGGNFQRVAIEEDPFMESLKPAIFAIEVNDFEKSTDNKGVVHYNPTVSGFGPKMEHSEPDLNFPRPTVNQATGNDPFNNQAPVADNAFGPEPPINEDPFA